MEAEIRAPSRVLAATYTEDDGINPSTAPNLNEIVASRLSRREALVGLLATAGATGVAGAALAGTGAAAGTPGGTPGSGGAVQGALAPVMGADTGSSLTFRELVAGVDLTHAVAPGYEAEVLIRWGEPLVAGAPAFDPGAQTPAAQERQFGYNNDFIGFLPLPIGSNSADHGLLYVNHEYTNTDHMFPGITEETAKEAMTLALTEVELAAHGGSVVEVKRGADGRWAVVAGSRFNRRITTLATKIALSGPAAGHDRLKTSADPSGRSVIGMLNNCAGGTTPWGTVLSAEENFHQYFSGTADGTREEQNYKRVGIVGKPEYPWWGKQIARFDLAKEPNEPNRFGWVVEIDPYDPAAVPVKRTALGRFKHENATTVVNRDGRVVVYSGDDERFEHVYKFVTNGTYNPKDRAANLKLLDEGTLFVARFDADGTLTWLPLVQGQGPLTAENGFASQADVVIEARRAATLLGATPMDRPEDVEANPVTGVVYAMLTNNSRRAAADDPKAGPAQKIDAANPRAKNDDGQIVAMIPPGAPGRDVDHAATGFTWEVPILAGNPADPKIGARYPKGVTWNGWFSCPDNVCFDHKGRIWIATDQGANWQRTGRADGIWAADVQGGAAMVTRHFFRVPLGAEMCGPCFTPDDTTLFVSVQHPSCDGTKGSSFGTPATRWPDFRAGMPPRPSVVAITKKGGGVIGS